MKRLLALIPLILLLLLAIAELHAQQSAPLSNGDANIIQLAGSAAASFWTAMNNATGAILNLQTKQAADEATISSLSAKANTSASQIAALQAAVSSLQAQLNAIPAEQDGATVLAAGTVSIVFPKAFMSAPKCTIGATASPALSISVPTTTGFTITSSSPTDTQTVDWICRQ